MARLREEQGMTLVEVLMASVLMLIVLGATLTTFNNFERNVKTNEQQNEAQEQARRAMDLMARDLRNLASPTPYLPLAVDRHEALDLIFQSEGKEKPAGSLNAQNTTRVRYCVDAVEDRLYRQTQTWTSAPAGRPRGHGLPGTGLDQDDPGRRRDRKRGTAAVQLQRRRPLGDHRGELAPVRRRRSRAQPPGGHAPIVGLPA